MSKHLEIVRKKLNETSGSFCLAKWLQVTVHLQNGMTHSCHHPIPHKIPLAELDVNRSALHNTKFKKLQRRAMLNGLKPKECDYCWKIENASPDNISDRVYKSGEEWALPHINDPDIRDWEKDIKPTYLEVSFGNECQFKCAYCTPVVSSGVMSEYHQHGGYKALPHFHLDNLKKLGEYPYAKGEHNPYVDAFWDWWEDLNETLEVFRITGGEPLLNSNTFQFLEGLIKSPRPKLDIAVNSNLSVPANYLDRFTDLVKVILSEKKCRKFEVYTSLDTFGEQAEYIRFGLDYDEFLTNIRNLLKNVPKLKLTIMCTFNALSVPRFKRFLEEIRALKLEFRDSDYDSRIMLNIPYLRYPPFMSAAVLPDSFISTIEESLDYMLRNAFDVSFQVFSDEEIGYLRRILEWVKSKPYNQSTLELYQSSFFSFFSEYDSRKGTDFEETFPEFKEFWQNLKSRSQSSGQP